MKSSIGRLAAMGADVGFGNLKISCSTGLGAGALHECVLPAGAQRMSDWDPSARSLDGGEAVLIQAPGGGVEEWIAGIEPRLLNRSTRVLNEHYPRSNEYAALFAAGLIRSGMSRVELLVTGLPVKQFFGVGGEAMREHVRRMMTGRHHANAHHCIEVAEVLVVPQPLGTFTALLAEPQYGKLRSRIKSLTTLCLDVGFGTVDWVLLGGNVVKPHSSYSSGRATSHLLEDAARRVSMSIGRTKSRDVLDEALRNGRPMLEIGLDADVDYRSYIHAAAGEVADEVMDEVKNTLRLNEDLDLIILTGGGAEFYAEAARKAFPNVDVVRPENPVLANARGYRLLAEMELRRRSATSQVA